MDVGEEDVSREVFLVDLSWGRFMNSNSEVTDTVDFPDLAWLALDRGDTRVTFIGIFGPALFLPTFENQSLISILGRKIHRDEVPEIHMCPARRPAND